MLPATVMVRLKPYDCRCSNVSQRRLGSTALHFARIPPGVMVSGVRQNELTPPCLIQARPANAQRPGYLRRRLRMPPAGLSRWSE